MTVIASEVRQPLHHNNMKLSLKNIMLLALMLLSAGLGFALRPTISLADERPPIDLPAMVPTAFGEWREETNQQAQVVNPQQKGVIDKIYSQTLSRTYINPQGYRIMLSIAYGKNQSDALSLHRPEVCYPSQGFSLVSQQRDKLSLMGGHIEVSRMEASLGQRIEPVTYWIVVGDHIVTTGIHKKLVEMRYALAGRIPDGMLIRVSSIDKDPNRSIIMHNRFASDLVAAIASRDRSRFSGDEIDR
jgi:EpsI family protein